MNILVATSKKSLAQKIKNSLRDKHTTFTFIPNMTMLNNVIKNSFNNYVMKKIFKVEYDLIILDEVFFELMKAQDLVQAKDELMNFVTLLLVDDFEDIDADLLVEDKISGVISSDFTEQEFYVQVKLLVNNFKNIKETQSYAYVDALTSLFNRRTFINNMERYFTIFKQYQIPFCVGIIDLDNFKIINDTYGHLIGDKVLKEVSDIMQQNFRYTDVLARIGGEEFGIIFPGIEMEGAFTVLDRVRTLVSEAPTPIGGLEVTFSAGLSKSKDYHNSYEEIIQEADLLLYKAKDSGRNTICQ